MSLEEVLYDKLYKKVNFYFSISGAYLDKKDANRSLFQRFRNRPLYCFNLVHNIIHILSELLWLKNAIYTESFVKITYTIPCMTLCLLSMAKSFYLIRYGDVICNFMNSVKMLQANSAKADRKIEIENETKKRTTILTIIFNANTLLYFFGMTVFVVGPVALSMLLYRSSGKLEMLLPFFSVLPFDSTDIRYWPFAYIHQLWAGVTTVSAIHGADSFHSYSCTFLIIQFKTLNYDIKRICPENADIDTLETQKEFRARLIEIVKRHRELIRCVDLIEIIYSKPTFVNVAVSSIVICLSGFNLMTIRDMLVLAFVAFILMWTLQMFVLCYFSDLIIESSMEVSDAVYQSKWYNLNAAMMKDLLLVLSRARKPCKLTALGFTDLNLGVFRKICSSSWSYFALLQTVYDNE